MHTFTIRMGFLIVTRGRLTRTYYFSYGPIMTCDLIDTAAARDVSIAQWLVDRGLATRDDTRSRSSAATSESNLSRDSGGSGTPRYYPG